jgi:type III pantothenate kinase
MNLCIDIGNTLLKVAIFVSDNQMIQKFTFESEQELTEWADSLEFQNAIISSVRGNEETLLAHIHSTKKKVVFNKELKLPIKNLYLTPATLGKDRLASAIGASALFPKQNCLVIDSGTCITYDFITANGEYLGGSISPGMQMRFKALNHFTAKLPLIEPDGSAELIGTSTESSIQSGVINGIRFEIEKTMEEYQQNYPDLQVILCGGDAHFFESIIKGVIFAFPDLVLFGLNHTLHHNAIS